VFSRSSSTLTHTGRKTWKKIIEVFKDMERLTKAFALYKKKRKEKRKSHLINLREVSSYSWWLMETSCLQFVTGL